MGNPRWKSFRTRYKESDLWVALDAGRYDPPMEKFVLDRILCYRNIIEDHITVAPEFASSLAPLVPPSGISQILTEMYSASQLTSTGPMSSVAGVIAEYICNDLLMEFNLSEVIIENGGDIFMKLTSPATISIYAGDSPLSEKIGLDVKPENTPLSVCCSSGKIGHSLSFGIADACMVACRSGALADAFATACCNRVKSSKMIGEVTEHALLNPEILSVVIISGDKVAIGGEISIRVLS